MQAQRTIRNDRSVDSRITQQPRNSWFFKRDTEAMCVIVTANYIPRQETWSMHCKINGELVDACLADDPWKEAQAMLTTAFSTADDPVPAVTATVTDDAPVPEDA